LKKTEIIETTLVPEEARMGILPKYLGVRHMMRGEALIFDWMKELCEEYSGGHWDMVEVSNGTFYMRQPKPAEVWLTGMNQTTRRVSADAAGVIATLYALDSLAHQSGSPEIGALHQRLLAFVGRHAESAAIKALVD